ncbi:MAG: SDR family oxidoreductase [Bacillota bacterium]|nr:SDR family oxidoreductase [Bacillota bacterium]MDW7685050.1 SDR family oxidoreductase [Bacillota bacterium]
MNIFANKVAIITGGASGIGKSICTYLAQHGSLVVIADCNLDGALETEAFVTANGGRGQAVHVDISNPQEMKDLIENTAKQYGQIDFLFNNAGISVNGEFQDISLEQWKKILDVNLWGVIYGCYYVYPIMIRQGFGHIINTASLAGLIPGGLTTSYSSSKHAVVGFSLSLRSEAKQYGIKVSTLCPGYLRTNIQNTTLNVSEYLNSEKNKKMNQSMNFLTPDDCIGQIMSGVKKNKGIIVAPNKHKVYWWMHRALPEFIPNMFYRIIRQMKSNI